MFAEESLHYSHWSTSLELVVETLGMSTWKFDIAEERAVLSMALYPSVALDPNYTSVTGICLPKSADTTLTGQQY
jgi:hypothetical protein